MPSLPSQQFLAHSSLQFVVILAETMDFLIVQNRSHNFYHIVGLSIIDFKVVPPFCYSIDVWCRYHISVS